MTKEEKIAKLDELKKMLDGLKPENLQDDGSDDGDELQNINFCGSLKQLDKVYEELAWFNPCNMSSEALNELWQEVWKKQGSHGIFERINFCYDYIKEMKSRV